MSKTLRLLILEDSPEDAELAVASLESAGYSCKWDRVETRKDFLKRLEDSEYDLVLTDYSLPNFDGLSAVKLFVDRGLDIPIIHLSGTIGEEVATESLKAGATDFVLKDKMFRLPHVVDRALREAEGHRQRRRAEVTLRESERKFRSLVEHAGDGIAMVEPDGRYRDVNSSFCSMMGYSRAELLTMHANEVTVPEESPLVPAALNRIAAGEPHIGEWQLRRRDGSILPVEITARKLPDGNLLGIVRDITERKLAEEQKQKLVARNESLVRAMAQIVYEWWPKTGEVRWEGDFTGILGYSAEQMGHDTESWTGRIHPDDLDAAMAEVEAARRERRLYHMEYRFRRHDGAYAWMNDRAILQLDSEGEIEHMLGVFGEITDRKNLEEQFLQSQKMEAVGVLAGGIAHDFNNFLTAINGYSDLTLRKMPQDDPLRQNIEEIKNAGLRAVELTAQLLAFSRKQVLKPSVINFNTVITNIENMLRRIIKESVELRVVLDPNLGNVKADPGQIEQVIMNLAVNARDAMPDGGILTIKTQNISLGEEYAARHVEVAAGHYVRLIVTDTGEGMNEQTQKRAFEPFFTTKQVGEGTGLGLSTVHGIVKQSGGDIQIYSEIGHGTTFKIYFPCVDEAIQKPRWAGGIKEDLSGTETILLVEDEDVVRSLVREILTGNGYTVLEADGGEAALSICDNYAEHIDLMLTDLVMPKMSGNELKDHVVKSRPDIKVLFMSGYTDDSITHDGALDSAAAFVEKPFTPDGLARKVREVLEC